MRLQPREQLTHSLNPYIHKCCGCIHLRTGATLSCLMWANSPNGIRAASHVLNTVIMILSVDTIVNTILFIVRRDEYMQWCINSTSGNLDNVLFQEQLAPLLVNGTQKFSSSMNDFYNCRRTWEGELKFSVLSTIVMVTIYIYWAISIFSYTVKIRMRVKNQLMKNMQIGMMANRIMP
ncbi:hypothetical protein MFLAVUS_000063 [Mucor flavus]|uniref:Uncharacterized protein n=1 Tax=Mucor flavus TaxID=439312 RepID=A0ABP9YIP1_9FUNG